MANVLAVDDVIVGQGMKIVRYKVTLSGSYVQAVRGANTGEVLVLNGATGIFKQAQFWGQNGPKRVYVVNLTNGYAVGIQPGADALHWLLVFFGLGVNTQLAAGAYPAPITGDLDFYIEAVGREFD